ncbi:MAG: hypothetical protein H5T33_02350 [Candidatus Methanosuratus sp.]|nr:hypothetical protein [Candidatus Methanosuratincola sp.]
MHDEILNEINEVYERKINELKTLAQSYQEEIASKINLRRNMVNKEAETKSEVAP